VKRVKERRNADGFSPATKSAFALKQVSHLFLVKGQARYCWLARGPHGESITWYTHLITYVSRNFSV
jgi:hypothetical protein